MPSFTIGQPIVVTDAHYADADATLEARLVDLTTGDPVFDWDAENVEQTTASEDGPSWTYEATWSSVEMGAGVDRYQAEWRTSTAGPWIDDDEITLGTLYGWDPPSVDDLSALIFARVSGEFGPLQQWDETTRPTREQAQTKVDMAHGLIAAQLPALLAARYHEAARAIVVLTAAILTEPGYWPEDLKDYRDAVEEWRKERDAALEGVLAAIKRDTEEEEIEAARNAEASAFNPACATDPCGDYLWCNPLPPVEVVG